ncbi:MAG: hypothetical protein ABEK36_05270 [Candidatus Aenigmatarchaeota archaeon]
MRNKYILGFVFLMIISVFVTGAVPVYETDFIIEGKIDLDGTIINDYNKGKFRIDDGIDGVFRLEINDPEEKEYILGYSHAIDNDNNDILFYNNNTENLDFHICYRQNLSSSNDTIYGKCLTYPDDTGKHFATVIINSSSDTEYYYYQTVTVLDALPDIEFYIFFIIGLILALIGYLTSISSMYFLSIMFIFIAELDIINTYNYNPTMVLISSGITIITILILYLLATKEFN